MVVGGIMVGGTDSKHFMGLSDNVYRYCPTWMLKSDIPRFHVSSERHTGVLHSSMWLSHQRASAEEHCGRAMHPITACTMGCL